MDQVKQQIMANTAILDPYAAMVPALKDASAKLDVNPGAILGLIGSFGLLILLMMQGWTILLTTITVLYPAILSIRAIQSQEDDDDKVWLTYWMVFGVFNVMETFLGFIFWFVPYWEWVRLGLFVWLLMPQFKGAKVIYDKVLQPQLTANKATIEKWISMTANVANNAKESSMEAARQAASDPTLLAKGLSAAASVQDQVKTATTPSSADH